MIERNAKFYPNREAFICGERRITNAELADRAKRFSGALHSRGINRQDRVCVLSMNNLEYYETYRACEWGGFIIAPVNFRLAPPEILYILRDAAPRVLVFEANYAHVVEQLRPELTGIEIFVCIGQGPDWSIDFETLIANGPAEGPPEAPKPEDYCYLHYSSGTTGKPKGVVRTHDCWVDTNNTTALVTEFNGATRLLQTSPAFHTGGIGYVNGASWMGGTVVIHRTFDPVATLEAISRENITFTFMVAAMLQAVCDVPDIAKYDISSMKGIATAAAPVPVPLLKRGIELFGPIFSVQFGMTESSGTYLPAHDVNPHGTPDQIRRLASVGHPCPGIQLRVVTDDGRDCEPGEAGEVWLRSNTQLDCYWNNSVATTEAICDGWYKTGDVGYQDDEGYLFLVDRKKDMIISGGENIYSREVEIAIAEHSAVMDCAVVGKPDPKWGESVHALVVLKSGAEATAEEIIAHCRARIASYKCPKSVDFAADLPRTTTGKISKLDIRKGFTPG
jgi:acyl-CoA synthetase (AMP-forming)/AMP-acid ligase II